MGSITIITGPPGAGKTTLARTLAHASPRGAHVPGDLFYTFLAHPIHPALPASNQQNAAVIRATARAAGALAAAEYEVYMDGIFGSWFLPVIAQELRTLPVKIACVVLMVTIDEALRRAGTRAEPLDEWVIRQMQASFLDLREFTHHAIDVTNLDPEETAAEFRRVLPSLALDISRIGEPEIQEC